MSYTEIFAFNKQGEALGLANVKNAWRGAMAIWTTLEDRYLPENRPYKDMGKMSRMSSPNINDQKEVWGLVKDDRLSEDEKIVLASTFDNVIVMKEDFPRLIEAFRNFVGQTSLKEQADILHLAMGDDDIIAIGWNQTSVNCDTWATNGPYNEETDESSPYNIFKQTEHWNLFEP